MNSSGGTKGQLGLFFGLHRSGVGGRHSALDTAFAHFYGSDFDLFCTSRKKKYQNKESDV